MGKHLQKPARGHRWLPGPAPCLTLLLEAYSEDANSPIVLQLWEKSEGNLNSPQTALLSKRDEKQHGPGTSVVETLLHGCWAWRQVQRGPRGVSRRSAGSTSLSRGSRMWWAHRWHLAGSCAATEIFQNKAVAEDI